MDKNELISALSRIDFWRELFAALVAIGIVGEVIFGFRYSSKAKQLQAVQKAEERELTFKIEGLRNENLKLKAAMSPRGFNDQGGAAARLAKFGGVSAVIMHAADAECTSAAKQIEFVLILAKWNLKPMQTVSQVMFPGVTVSLDRFPRDDARGSDKGEEFFKAMKETEQPAAAERALMDELSKTGMDVREQSFGPKFPPGLIVIRVGMKLSPEERENWNSLTDMTTPPK